MVYGQGALGQALRRASNVTQWHKGQRSLAAEFYLWDPPGRGREPFTPRCPLISTCTYTKKCNFFFFWRKRVGCWEHNMKVLALDLQGD